MFPNHVVLASFIAYISFWLIKTSCLLAFSLLYVNKKKLKLPSLELQRKSFYFSLSSSLFQTLFCSSCHNQCSIILHAIQELFFYYSDLDLIITVIDIACFGKLVFTVQLLVFFFSCSMSEIFFKVSVKYNGFIPATVLPPLAFLQHETFVSLFHFLPEPHCCYIMLDHSLLIIWKTII